MVGPPAVIDPRPIGPAIGRHERAGCDATKASATWPQLLSRLGREVGCTNILAGGTLIDADHCSTVATIRNRGPVTPISARRAATFSRLIMHETDPDEP